MKNLQKKIILDQVISQVNNLLVQRMDNPDFLQNRDILSEVTSRVSNETLESISHTSLWDNMPSVISDQNWWKRRTEYLVGRSLAPAVGNWRRLYASLKKNGLEFNYKQDYRSSLLVSVLLQAGADPSAGNGDPITGSIYGDNILAVRLLLQDGRVDPDEGDLDEAINNGYGEITALLLQDPRVNPASPQNDALLRAVYEGDVQTVALILSDPRVDPSLQNDKMLIMAASYNQPDIVRMLLSDDRVDASVDGDQPLIESIKRGFTEVVRVILEMTDLPLEREHCIAAAAQLGDMEIFNLLLKKGPYDLSWNNNHALRLARRYKKREIELLLLEDPEVRRLDTEIR